jgi:hypothetical protein
MEMFVKLNKQFEKPLFIVSGDLNTFSGVDDNGKQIGVFYKSIFSPDKDKVYKVVPKKYWPDFDMTLMTINHKCPPHIDNNIISSINFYIETHNYKTVFYKNKDTIDDSKIWRLDNQTDGCMFNYDVVEETGSFIAQPNDIWLLDVKKIHSVEPLGEMKIRKAITLATNKHKFEDVCNMMKETGYL